MFCYFARRAIAAYTRQVGFRPDGVYADLDHWGVSKSRPFGLDGVAVQDMPARSFYADGYISAVGWSDENARTFFGQAPPNDFEILFAEMAVSAILENDGG